MQDELWDFFLEGGDELMNSEQCPHCIHTVYLDQAEYDDETDNIIICPKCGKKFKII
ncbi:MAG: hypothetical protein PHV17_06840 [Candidatus Omnitrophica bacterium]|nr:hypothetical protein [Candidatus Omnitrophota bacterium]